MQLEDYLERDDRIVLPLGSTEQHAYISLETDNILAGRVAEEAAAPLGVPVLPVLAYGVTPRFAAYPGSPSISAETYVRLLSDLTGSLRGQGFHRILLVNGHGGNSFAAEEVEGEGVRWHDWWRSERIRALVDEIDPEASHASWMETFPWTRLEDVALPEGHKGALALQDVTDPGEFRGLAGDGSFGRVLRAAGRRDAADLGRGRGRGAGAARVGLGRLIEFGRRAATRRLSSTSKGTRRSTRGRDAEGSVIASARGPRSIWSPCWTTSLSARAGRGPRQQGALWCRVRRSLVVARAGSWNGALPRDLGRGALA